jgi:SAM-dependent methyltransferase
MTPSPAADFGPEYFQTAYRSYDRQNPRRKLLFYRTLVTRYAPPRPRPAILELGCAYGKFLACLDSSWRKFGVDVSEFGIRQARRAAPDAKLVIGSCAATPLRGPFDVVVAFDVLEHVDPLEPVGDFVVGALTEGGIFVIVVPVYDGPLGRCVRMLDKDRTHVHRHARSFWLSWMSRRFVVRDWWGLTRYLLPGGAYLNWPSRRLRNIAPAIAVVGQKEPPVKSPHTRRTV